MHHGRGPHPGTHVGWKGSEISIFFIKSIVKPGVDIIIDLIRGLKGLCQAQPRGQDLDADVIHAVEHQADVLLPGNQKGHGRLFLQNRGVQNPPLLKGSPVQL